MQRFYTLLAFFVLNISALTAFGQATYCTPKYSGNGYGGTGNAIPFFTHFQRVACGNVDRRSPAPASVAVTKTFDDFTATDTMRLVQTGKYPIAIELGNGANNQTFAVWIDYNQNGLYETVEMIYSRTDVANKGNHKYSGSITIPKNSVVGTTRMRVGTLYGNKAPDPCNNSRADNFPAFIADWSQHFQEFSVEILKPTIQIFENVEVFQSNFNEIVPGSDDNELLKLNVNTNEDGALSPLIADSFYFTLNGCTNPGDIESAKLYVTGKNADFNTGTLVNEVKNPGTSFVISGNKELRPGINYYWLAVKVKSTALLGNLIDAQCQAVSVTTKRIPLTVSPGGNRQVGYCHSQGNRSVFVYVYGVQFGRISTFSYFTTGYSNYTTINTTANRGDSIPLSVYVGNSVNSSFTKVWIDFNGDGDFNDAGENVMFDSLTVSPTSASYGPVSKMVYIPKNAKVGPTRMRVTSAGRADAPPYKPAPGPCDEDVEIGEVEDYTVIISEDGEPVADFAATTVCLGDSTSFADKSYTFNIYSINSWSWDFGDGNTSTLQNPKHLYSKAGVYTVKLTANTNKPGTAATKTKIITVESPKANFSYNTTLNKVPIYFTDASTVATVVRWEWDFGDPSAGPMNYAFVPNPVFTYASTGSYKVKLIIYTLGGCVDSITKTIDIVSELKPIANFTANEFDPYKTATVFLKDISINRPTSWKWSVTPSSYNFVNATTATSQNPNIQFNALTTYTVKMVVSNTAGKDSITRKFTTKDYLKPTVDFSANRTAVKAGQLVSFLDLSTNDPTYWEWIYGDGDTGNVDNPLHEYGIIGKYTVKLTASNPAGSDNKTKIDFITVTDEYNMCESDVKSSPLYKGTLYDAGGSKNGYGNNTDCGFLIKPDCAGPITIAFQEFAMATGDFVKVYDGEDENGIPLFVGAGFTGYSKPAALKAVTGAVYIVQTSDASLDSTGFKLTWSATPNTKPKAVISGSATGYVNSAMLVENKTVIGAKNTYSWDLDNDGIDDAFDPKQVLVNFSDTGMTRVRLVAKNCKGTDTAYLDVHVVKATAPPVADFFTNTTKVYSNDEVEFFDISDNGPNRWKWNVSGDPFNYLFVNGTSDSSRNPVILFFEPGYYTISLTATNDLGSSKTTVKTNYILVQFRATMCLFPDVSDAPGGIITDDNTGTGGIYTSSSCDFLIAPCAKEIVLEFSEFSYRPGDYLRVYDGNSAAGKPLFTGAGFGFGNTPTKLIAKSGAMFIEHRASGFANTSYTGFVAKWTSVPYNIPTIGFEVADTAYTGGNLVFFNNLTDENGNPKVRYAWDFENDGIVDSMNKNPIFSYATPGLYTVELAVHACEFADSVTQKIRVINPKSKPKAAFSTSQTKADVTDVVTLTDRSTNGPGKWRWEITPATYSTVDGGATYPIFKLNFNKPDTYTVKLVVSNNLGKDSITKVDYIIVFQYCTPVVNQVLSAMGMTYVEIGDVKNNSLTGLSPYSDYTTVGMARLTADARHVITIVRNGTTPGQNYKAWIDYNQDGVFDPSTELVMSHSVSTDPVIQDTLHIDKNATYGITRLRIGTSLGNDANTPCGPNNYGEFEDYRVVIGPDDVKPVITLIGDNPAIVELGYAYNDSGATAWDNLDGDITDSIVIVNTVNINKPGTYTVTYNVKDKQGNKAKEVVRTVFVTGDITKPIVTLKGKNPDNAYVFMKYNDPGATAMDNIDGDITASIERLSNIDTARVGSYEVIYTAYDNAGNAADAVVRNVNVVDTVAPQIKLRGLNKITLIVGDAYVEDSADVTDNYYDDVLLLISGTVNTNKEGTYTRFYDAADRSGNSAVQKKRTIEVQKKIGVDELAIGEVKVFPVPAVSLINVSLHFPSTGHAYQLKLINSLGETILTRQLYTKDQDLISLPLDNISAGVYYIDIETGQDVMRSRFTVIK